MVVEILHDSSPSLGSNIVILLHFYRIPLTDSDVSGIQKSFWEQVFEASANGIWLLAVQNMVPELLWIGPILSVCLLFVCLFNFLQTLFLIDFEQNSFVIS